MMPLGKVRSILVSMFDPYVLRFDGKPDVPLENELAILDPALARWTPSGWRFHAGATWKAKANLWKLVSRSDTSVPEIIQSGWKPEFQGNLRPAWFSNPPQTDEAEKEFQVQHDTLFLMEAIKQVDAGWVAKWGLPAVVMPFFMVFQDPEKGWRPIGSAIYSNLILEPAWFPLPTINEFLVMITRGSLPWAVDFKAGWMQMLISKQHAFHYVYEFAGRLFVFRVFAFGDAVAPEGFTYMGLTFRRHLRKNHIPHFLYIDDLAGPGSTNRAEADRQFNRAVELVMDLGGVLGLKKAQRPSTKLDLVGFVIDTEAGLLSIRPKRLTKMETVLADCLSKAVTSRRIAKLVGSFVSAAPVLPGVHTFVSNLYKYLGTDLGWDKHIQIAPSEFDGVRSAIAYLKSTPRKLWISPSDHQYLITDAVLTQGGAYLCKSLPQKRSSVILDQVSTSVQQDVHKETAFTRVFPGWIKIINQAETYTVVWAVSPLAKFLNCQKLVILVDNTTSIAQIKKGYSKDEDTNTCVRKFWPLVRSLGINQVDVIYIKSEWNPADGIIRLPEEVNADWQLDDVYFQKILRWVDRLGLPPPSADVFAARHNALLPTYMSIYWDEGSVGNFFTHEPPGRVVYGNPPFQIVGKAIARAKSLALLAYLVYPVWTRCSWWFLTAMARYKMTLRPVDEVLMFIPRYTPRHYTQPSFEVCVGVFDFRS